MERIKNRLRQLWLRTNPAVRKLRRKDFTIIASNCNGTFIMHDLGVRFNTPFVNLWIKPKDFIKLLSDLPRYLETEMTFVQEPGINYPIGLLEDVRIYFQHYTTPEQAKEKWLERKKRMHRQNLFILFSDRDGCTYQDLCDFDRLPYKNKVVFTHLPYPELSSAYYLKGWESEQSIGDCFSYKSRFSIKRRYDDFDYIKWLSQ